MSKAWRDTAEEPVRITAEGGPEDAEREQDWSRIPDLCCKQ